MVVVPTAVSTRLLPLDMLEDEAWSAAVAADDATHSSHTGAPRQPTCGGARGLYL
jgi:hypothetical protein